ncbi:hypothetical protein MLD52_22890 [Puniceicoccaceae bacterium K14]|nr:hypothetical protein [Puniceicoccaceae bacterium K14]
MYGGEPNLNNIADPEYIAKFDYQFLDAIRDVERDMLTGGKTLLKDVLNFFIDYEIKNDSESSLEEKSAKLEEVSKSFSTKADVVISELQKRMEVGKNQILSYAKSTGAAFDGALPNFDGKLSDIDMFSSLRLIVEHTTGITIPASRNGLG